MVLAQTGQHKVFSSLRILFKLAENGFSQNGEVGKLTVWPLTLGVHFPQACLLNLKMQDPFVPPNIWRMAI